MQAYFVRRIQPEDYPAIAAVYNSNPCFLRKHLGLECVDEEFVAREAEEMNRIGFSSCVIMDKECMQVLGVLDYRPGHEVYLSLLMLSGELHGRGLGRRIYEDFEKEMRRVGSKSIRIDVVNDYPDNLVSYWKKLGFCEDEIINLKWGNRMNKALVMRKHFF